MCDFLSQIGVISLVVVGLYLVFCVIRFVNKVDDLKDKFDLLEREYWGNYKTILDLKTFIEEYKNDKKRER